MRSIDPAWTNNELGNAKTNTGTCSMKLYEPSKPNNLCANIKHKQINGNLNT